MSTSRMIFGKNNDVTEDQNRFLYIIEALNVDEDGDSVISEIDADQWRGRIHQIQQHVERSNRNLKKDQDEKLKEMKEEIRHLNGKMINIEGEIKNLDGKMENIGDKVEKILQTLVKEDPKNSISIFPEIPH